MATVNRNMFGASITEPPGGAQLMALPLNLIAEIVSHVDDTGDLARLCRTCRVLNYMALPQLYRSLTLTSYDKIRYRDEQPEGIGSASPFTMGLNAIITRSYATLVRSMTLRGEWKEYELEEHAQVGRVPDASMLLNIAARAAIDRMTNLESFHWELNTKMLDTVFLGLTQLPKLTSLTIRFPSSRHPQPTFVIPGMPHLRCLKITDIDPLCYPDDISTLLYKSRKLRELKLHWSPRMRDAHEPSVSLHDYFRKLIASKQPLAVKKMTFQNLYAFHTEEFNWAFDPTTVEDVTFLSGLDGSSLVNTFVENSWPTVPPHAKLRMKSIRMDAVSKRSAEFIGNFSGLERLYFVNVTSESSDILNCPRPGGGVVSSALTPPVSEHHSSGAPGGTTANSPITSASPASQLNAIASMRDIYLSNITTNHGATLRHLLLPSKWPLSTGMVARLVHSCPNLEQLALATEFSSMDSLGLLIPFLRKLKAIRLLIPPPTGQASGGPATSALKIYPSARFDSIKMVQETFANAKTFAEVVDIDDSILTEMLSYDLANKQVYGNVKIISMGWKAWELKDFYKAPIPLGTNKESQTPNGDNASPETTTDSSAPTQGTDGIGPSAPYQPAVSHKSPDTQTTHISSWSKSPGTRPILPPSTLGKRSRDLDGCETHRPPPCPRTPNRAEDNEGVPVYGCYPHTFTDDGFVWKRRARRVGWEVLQHWEVWALDSQEI
ncbi:hypothetical protein DTO013E5_363 [Penicillium roqueforti]|uniref:Genomic scaffold, ProqFM164S02 n=1 Tax=Penicillium roqueforti (strain FM164) TaxID=1365484 RepID=W6Q9Z0_PENRF|nr:uncharacterized protein LCP9604111_775 [Penicillium roqueforti]CDM30994.1 unnamed protein product [Penicillium roqueforti FM164]KAF9253249.1 hypothetical protein LCP9604111_775 [Penicillium roqueforti]KAI1838766.1 hypothetical protein CBS147337_491 [Penicillium roqueforti]KAI2680346.1 hypothetical protein CBS147355_3326 [Penicillium roqueforti]KAI2691265.1 hypothetical protein LCP963914a_1466 [Penicillium roqueforti]